MLSAGAGGAEGVDAQVVSVQLELHVVHLRQHRHGDGAGVDAPAGLGLRHPLDTVDAALVLHPGVGPRPVQGEHGLFHAAQLGLVGADLLLLPPSLHAVHAVHPAQRVGKKGGLFAAHPGTHLDDDALAVVRVLGDEEGL